MKAKLLLVLFGFLFLMPLFAEAAFVPAKADAAASQPAEQSVVHQQRFGQRLRHVFSFGRGRASDRVETNGWAIASLVCGIVAFLMPSIGLVAVFAAAAIICGVLGMQRRKSHGMAVAGFILGIVAAVIVLIAAGK